MRTRSPFLAFSILLALGSARADDLEDPARKAFREGAALVEQSEWSSALAAFERSHAARPHALTLYNVAVCQRFLGRYTLARETLRAALARNEAHGEMPALFVDQAHAYEAEIDQKLARVTIALTPKSARVAVEGRPLAADHAAPGVARVFVAGVADAGEPKALDLERLEVLVDPRPTVFTFSLDGYDTIEVRRDLKPGAREELPVSMTEQPAQIKVASNVVQAIVRVDGVDVGMTPITVTRPPGARVVSVAKDGFVPYESKLSLRPGQSLPLDAQLAPEKTPITKKWWFWAGAAVVLAGASVGTYFAVRPGPTRPEANAGGLGWIAEVR
jgi:hypothetical protein